MAGERGEGAPEREHRRGSISEGALLENVVIPRGAKDGVEGRKCSQGEMWGCQCLRSEAVSYSPLGAQHREHNAWVVITVGAQ